MKQLKNLIISSLLIAVAIGCTKPVLANLTMLTSFLNIVASGDSQDISFKTNQNWSISSDAAWVTASPSSGAASDSYQFVTVTVAPNTEAAERTATLTVKAGEKSAQVSIKQGGKPVVSRMTVQEFRNKKVDETTWYELSGEIAAIIDDAFGNFYLFDETGYVYVYGLCKTQRPKSGNDQTFAELGLKPGDKVTMMTLRSEHHGTVEAGGQTPAYFVSKTAGEYKLGKKVASTKAGWLELPATSATDNQDLLIHYFPDGKRSYAAYYDYEHFLSTWVAYPLTSDNIGTGSRTDAFSLDPLVPRAQQQCNPSGYKEGNVKGYSRGHQLPSADRLDWRMNIETFFGTNMTPQDETLNGGAWDSLEGRVRKWAKASDTDSLYVVTGCSVAGSSQYVLDGDGKHIPVPVGYFKALLRQAKDKSYMAVGFWLDNKPMTGTDPKNVAMSVDDLEKKVGIDFFVNLPDDTEKAVEAQDPATASWWWAN